LNNNKASLNTNYKSNYETSKIQNEQTKKPKFNSNINANSQYYSNPTRPQFNSNINNLEVPRDPYASTFVGLDTFSCKNVFLDLVESDLVLVNLDSSSVKNNLCFKGRCSIGLIHGQVKVNGYVLKRLGFENSTQFKWFDLYSPETNSYLSILNNRNESHENDNNENTQEIDYLSMQIRANTGLEFDNQLELKLREFLKQNKFNSSTSSLFVLRALKSHMCNYLSYFENFQHVYQSPSALVSNIADDKNQNLVNFDAKLEKLNMFPIGSEHFNAIHLERDEEIAVVNEILSSKCGFLLYLKKCGIVKF
jgi:hypothetical protein